MKMKLNYDKWRLDFDKATEKLMFNKSKGWDTTYNQGDVTKLLVIRGYITGKQHMLRGRFDWHTLHKVMGKITKEEADALMLADGHKKVDLTKEDQEKLAEMYKKGYPPIDWMLYVKVEEVAAVL